MPRQVSMGQDQEPLTVPDDLFAKLQQYGLGADETKMGAVARALADPDYADRMTVAALSGDAQFPGELLRAYYDLSPEFAQAPEQAQPQTPETLSGLAGLLGMGSGPAAQGRRPPARPQPQPQAQAQPKSRIPQQNPASLRALLGPYLNQGV